MNNTVNFTLTDKKVLSLPGFLDIHSASLFKILWAHLNENRVMGDWLEIGVFSGKTSMFMRANMAPSESLWLIDQSLNEEFEQQFTGLFGRSSPPHFINASSKSNKVKDLLRSSNFKFVHIDGEHTYEAVTNDLSLVADRSVAGGFVAVDDFFSFYYPQVTNAVLDFCKTGPLEIFLAGFNKAYLCHKDNLRSYQMFCRHELERYLSQFEHPMHLAKTSSYLDAPLITVVDLTKSKASWDRNRIRRGPDWDMENIPNL